MGYMENGLLKNYLVKMLSLVEQPSNINEEHLDVKKSHFNKIR